MTIRLKPEVVVITLTNLHHEVGHDLLEATGDHPRSIHGHNLPIFQACR